jgi:TRAP-type C4-dicarboxylate transport system substrate-binding protein
LLPASYLCIKEKTFIVIENISDGLVSSNWEEGYDYSNRSYNRYNRKELFMMNLENTFSLQRILKARIAFRFFCAMAMALILGQTVTDIAAAHEEPEYLIKFATIVPEGSPWANHIMKVKQRIEEESKGRIKTKIYLAGTLGGEVEMVRSLRHGRIQAFGGTTAAVAEATGIPELQALELPYLFDNLDEAAYILDNVVFEDFQKILNKKGFYLAYWHENGWRNFATKKIEINKPSDLRKLTMRSQESSIHLAMWRALGVQAEPIPTTEVMVSLMDGMVDGFDMSPVFTVYYGWYAEVDHYAVSQHMYQPAVILYSLEFFESLPKDLQTVLIGDPKKEMAWGRNAVREMNESLLQKFNDKGIKVNRLTEEERAVFREKLLPLHKDFEKVVGRELLEKIYAGKKEFASKSKSK